MSSTPPHPKINPRPVRNTYCIMTTLHMLELRKESYKKTLNKLEAGIEGLTNKYFEHNDVPLEVMDEIAKLNLHIGECMDIINSIDNAIETIKCTSTPPLSSAC